MLNQAVGVAVSWALAIIGTLVILRLVDATYKFQNRKKCKDWISQHGEEGYYWETPA